jgi:hypothetical protein
MKTITLMTFLFSQSVLAHESLPNTVFFQNEITNNSMAGAILNFCHLVGIET